MVEKLKAPFPWFGGKSRVAHLVWERFGDVKNYVEPFFGSGAVLLGRPHTPRIETINDKDGFVSNFWRAVKHKPDEVAHYADNPVNENDLHARHAYLVGIRDELASRLEGDPYFYEPKIAGWWAWGICCWIGKGWCSGNGSWQIIDGKLVNLGRKSSEISRARIHLSDAGMGVNRQLIHLSDAGMGVNRQLIHLSDAGMGVSDGLLTWMNALAARLRLVRVTSGDWARVCGNSPTTKLGLTGVFFDPPYSAKANRDDNVYSVDDLEIADQVRDWCIQQGHKQTIRIALCGYESEHEELENHGWSVVHWKTVGGYSSQAKNHTNTNPTRERIWFSPHCLQPDAQPDQPALLTDSRPDTASTGSLSQGYVRPTTPGE